MERRLATDEVADGRWAVEDVGAADEGMKEERRVETVLARRGAGRMDWRRDETFRMVAGRAEMGRRVGWYIRPGDRKDVPRSGWISSGSRLHCVDL